jgi:hypothetical protein
MAALDKKPRLKLPVQQRPHYHEIRKGLALGYRRNKGAGTWLVRVADGKGICCKFEHTNFPAPYSVRKILSLK